MKIRNKLVATLAAGACGLAVTGGAMAAVNYDPATGGFAGKGDVQLALGYNNAQLQDAVTREALTFTYADEVVYDVPCMKENQAQIQRRTFSRTQSLDATVVYDARKKQQFTGFILEGIDDAAQGEISCPGGWESDPAGGEPVLVSSSAAGLQVNGVALPEAS